MYFTGWLVGSRRALLDAGPGRRERSPRQVGIDAGHCVELRQVDPSGQWSIRINDQWRVCFRFEDGDAFDVEIVDYH
jgi:toxin HigB-1